MTVQSFMHQSFKNTLPSRAFLWQSPRDTSRIADSTWSRGLFLESPGTLRLHLGWHNSFCIFKRKAFRGTKLFLFLFPLQHMKRPALSRSVFYEWLFGPERFSGLSRNGPLVIVISFRGGGGGGAFRDIPKRLTSHRFFLIACTNGIGKLRISCN